MYLFNYQSTVLFIHWYSFNVVSIPLRRKGSHTKETGLRISIKEKEIETENTPALRLSSLDASLSARVYNLKNLEICHRRSR